jgi:hypothetical protein
MNGSHMTELIAFVGGFFTALVADPLRQWLFRPTLALEFANADHFIAQTAEAGGHQAKYVRVKVTNRGPWLAKSCRAYLVNIERRGQGGAWEATEYCESLQLAWSGRGDGAHGALDLPVGVPHFVDVVSMREIAKSFLLSTPLILMRYQALLASTGTFRLSVLISGENVRPTSLRLVFTWSGAWDAFQVSRE